MKFSCSHSRVTFKVHTLPLKKLSFWTWLLVVLIKKILPTKLLRSGDSKSHCTQHTESINVTQVTNRLCKNLIINQLCKPDYPEAKTKMKACEMFVVVLRTICTSKWMQKSFLFCLCCTGSLNKETCSHILVAGTDW